MERQVIRWDIIPFKDLPFRQLSPTDRALARPYAEKARARALELLGKRADVVFENGIYIMGYDFNEGTGYKGADAVIEQWHPNPDPDYPNTNEREWSVALYPDKVINRSNCYGKSKIIYDNGEVEDEESDVNEMYEVGAEELQRILSDMQGCSELTITTPQALSRQPNTKTG